MENLYRKRVGSIILRKAEVSILCIAIISACIIGCSTAVNKDGLDVDDLEEGCPYEEFIVVDVFDTQANYQGIQHGWFGEIVKKKFNMELNIIAPNVAGGRDTLFEVRAAAGNMGDLIIFRAEKGVLNDLVNAGLIYNMEDSLQNKQIMKYQNAIFNLNNSLPREGIYAIPSEVSLNPPDMPSEAVEPAFGPYIRWDYYKKLGYPQIQTLEDLLPVLSQMQELAPIGENGQKTYGFSFFKEWDDNMVNAVKQLCCFYGYDEYGFVLAKADGSDYQSIMDSDSLYIRMLQFYFKANQMGLIDPESVSQNYERCFEKYQQGQILFSPWPWLGQTAYNTKENKKSGKGYMMASIQDMQIYSFGCKPYGNQSCVIAVGAQAKDPDRLIDFIDWLYSSDGIYINSGNLAAAAGPQGLTWEMGEDGPYLTDFGVKALLDAETVTVPAEYGEGTWRDGTSALNYKAVAQCEKSEDNYYYYYTLWDSVRKQESSQLTDDWEKVMGADTTMEYLKKNHMLLVEEGTSYIAPVETLEQTTIRRQCKNAIQHYSWLMIFAADKAEFDARLQQMQQTVESYGYPTVLEYDLTHAKAKSSGKAVNVDIFKKY